MFFVCLGSVLEDSLFSVFRGFWDSYLAQGRKQGDQVVRELQVVVERTKMLKEIEERKKMAFLIGILEEESWRDNI